MADLVYMHKDKWTDHLDAIRAKAGTSDTMTVDEATTAVEGISGGTDTSDATLNSGGQMLSGVTAYSKGTKYTGTIPTQAAATITPTESAQTAVSAGKYTAGDVTVGAIPSDYIGTDIPRRSSISVSQDDNTIHVEDGYYEDDIDTSMGACTVTGANVSIDSQGDATGAIIVGRGGYINSGSHAFYVEDVVTPRSSSDLTASGATVSVPYGYYSADASKTVASGSAGTPTATKGSVSNHAVNVTPSVTNTTGYITGGTVTGTAVSVSASELVSGNKAITENGTGIDVANYSTVSVDVQGGSPAISVVDTTDSGGGTVRTITASGTTIPTPASDISKLILNGVTQMDVTDTTATVSDVASGKVFTQVDGTTGTGTASGGGWSTDGIAKHTEPSGDIVISYTGTIEKSAFYGCIGITSATGNNITRTSDSVFEGCKNMVSASFPALTNIGVSSFRGCDKLESIDIREATTINGSAFEKCYKLAVLTGGLKKLNTLNSSAFMNTDLTVVVLPAINGNIVGQVFLGCPNLLSLDIGSGATNITNTYNFKDCTSLETLILRKSSSIMTLNNTNAFMNTPFSDGGAGGTLYVPNDLIASYQSASNWSAILGYTNNQIKSIESTHTDPNAPIDLTLYYADGTLIPT